MKLSYILKRLAMFFAVILCAATINFAVPRLSPNDPTAAVLEQLISRGQQVQGAPQIIAA
jgi:peptide/nickel transport system permease protein